jgi:hypothetical protein
MALGIHGSIYSLGSVLALGALALSALRPPTARAQQPPTNGTLHVFLDCHSYYCDFDYFRETIPVVNWVRDRTDGDVHLLVTNENTAGGGTLLTLTYIGLKAFAGRTYTLRQVINSGDTYEEARAGFARAIELGLGPYLAETPAGRRVRVSYDSTTSAGAAPAEPEHDPWNFWVFRVRLNGSAAGESEQRFVAGNGSVSANRTTDRFKLSLSAGASGDRSQFHVVDTTEGLDTTYVSTRIHYSFETIAVWSLGAHWSLGAGGEADRSSTDNLDFGIQGGPTIEYDIFPYSVSTRRILTFRYQVGIAAANYTEETIFNRTSEVHPAHLFECNLDVLEPWGSVNAGVDAFQYLHDLSKHSFGVHGRLSVRVFRGLDLSLGGDVSRIKDQLYLSKAGLTPEEILLQRRTRGTDFRYSLSLGFSYRFGSKFNNVVNPRMR